MLVSQSKVIFDDLGEVVIKGMVGGRRVEYTGLVPEIDVTINDGISDTDIPSYREPIPDTYTYTMKLAVVDNKALTFKIGKKPITHNVKVYYGSRGKSDTEIEKCRVECGAPKDAEYKISHKDKHISFTWTKYAD